MQFDYNHLGSKLHTGVLKLILKIYFNDLMNNTLVGNPEKGVFVTTF
jgi:hypothetical protein